MNEQSRQNEDLSIRTGLQAGDDGGGATGPGVGTLGSGHAAGGGTYGSGH